MTGATDSSDPVVVPLGGRKIVLLSDGTGNSSAKLMKTNVWRIYEAVDLSLGDQVAYYDNGVGTSSFRLFALLGGAFGFGLKRNVRALYMFACRNVKPSDGDVQLAQLYLFGFSRGAFTMRVLMGLIEHQGLVTGASGADLKRRAKWAYRHYRRQFNATKGLVNPLRRIRDWLVRTWESFRGHSPYDSRNNTPVRIAFAGLWDTVDAYGLPIDEMTRGWDRWVWPLSMCERTPPGNVDKICHALALDDERHTFHPVLLDERHEPDAEHTNDERVTQVWFAGAHSNVGGGYPDDSLSKVPLRWMAREAVKAGLRLHQFVQDEWLAHADPHGPASDSRRGPGAYYRYNPRSIVKLCNDRFDKVLIRRPKIHVSVFRRIQTGRDEYAPIVLPARYAVVSGDGDILDGPSNAFEHHTQSSARCSLQERVWNYVWFRRITYFSTIAVTLALIVPPFVMTPQEAPLPLLSPASRGVAAILDAIAGFLPEIAQPITAFYREHPIQFLVLATTLTALLLVSSWLQRRIHDRMHALWTAIMSSPARATNPIPPPTDLVYRFRSHWLYRSATNWISRKLFPFIFGALALIIVLLGVAGTVNRAAFAVAGAFGTCQEVSSPAADAPNRWSIAFPSNELCYSTGILLEAGQEYTVSIETSQDWRDASIPVNGPAGFSTLDNGLYHDAVFLAALPFRRVLTARWFVPMARIGHRLAEYHALDQGTAIIRPRLSGQLFLFVNDAIGVAPFWRAFYANNQGSARVIVTRKVR